LRHERFNPAPPAGPKSPKKGAGSRWQGLGSLARYLLIALAGTLLGLAVSYELLQRGPSFGRIAIGPWLILPKTGAAEIDPYARAHVAKTGELVLAHAEGLSFLARTDSAGRGLDAHCTYRFSGNVPESRYWSLTLVSPAGQLIDNPARRYGFTSAEILRAADGSFEITIGRHARPGNWLPVATEGGFDLVLRVYDTLFDLGTAKTDENVLPRIERVSCE
jgi:hypothetical protein